MREDVWHRLDLIARNILPFFVTLLLIMVAMIPLRVPLLSPVIPALPLIAVYYWTVYKPHLMPVWAIFLIGLFHDLLTAGPAGVGLLEQPAAEHLPHEEALRELACVLAVASGPSQVGVHGPHVRRDERLEGTATAFRIVGPDLPDQAPVGVLEPSLGLVPGHPCG